MMKAFEFAGRWSWLPVILGVLSVAAYLLVSLARVEDGTSVAAELAELGSIQAFIAADAMPGIGENPFGGSGAALRLAVQRAEALPGRLGAVIGRDAADEALDLIVMDMKVLAETATAVGSGEGALSDISLPFITASGRVDRVLEDVSFEGQETTAGLHLAFRVGLAAMVVASVGSTVAYGWTSRRAGRLALDIERAREIDRAKSEFIALASHELRTPLTGIVGFSQLLTTRLESQSEEHEWAGHVHDESRRLSRLVDDMLDVSRIEAGKLEVTIEPVVLVEVVRQAVATVGAPSTTHPVEISGDESLLVLVDRDRLVQVVANLVENALKYSPDGGRITIECARRDDRVAVSVADEGLGVPPESLEHLFERFHRVDSPDRLGIHGTGPGLYVVRELVEAMGGEVGVESSAGAGSTFTIMLMAAKLQEAAA